MSIDLHSVIESLADRYLKWWKPTSDGKNIRGACPFHQEKTEGAFYMSTENGMFICHGCQARGSLNTFLREIKAPNKLRINIMNQVEDDLVKRSKREFEIKKDPFKNHMPLSESILGIFDYAPTDLIDAGFSKEVLQDYDIGFDKEAMRIIFPIRNHLGVLMGLSGRTVTNERPRYKIYKAVDLSRFSNKYHRYDFHKKNFLWNMDRIYPTAFHGELNHIFVVEGYKAALWLIQHGAWNTVALMGTYLSSMQQRLLSRLGATLIFLLDNTELAEKGVYEAGKWLSDSNNVRVCNYPEEMRIGAQPDELKAEVLIKTLETAENFLNWRIGYEYNIRCRSPRRSRIREQNQETSLPKTAACKSQRPPHDHFQNPE